MDSIQIDSKFVGKGRTYVIAEVGSNHNGDIALAKRLIDVAAEAGADAAKFQAFRAAEHYSRFTPGFTYLENKGEHLATYDLIKSLEIDRNWHALLMEHAKSRGITFLSSPCDAEAIDQLAALSMTAFKVASFDLPDLQLIRRMARFNRPIILSTGMATYADIESAVNTIHHEGNTQIILLQCTSLYPAPAELSNLAAMKTMQRSFGCLVGYSDHTLGDHVCVAAVALGATVIEKHITLDRKAKGPDHPFAIEPDELKTMIRRIREVEQAIGDGIKDGPRPAEKEMFEKGRRSLHAKRVLRPGDVIRPEDVCIKRPGYGIPPQMIETIYGMVVQQEIPEDHWIGWDALRCQK
jgi:N,N'-diacetyllegionaminate synthase